MTLETHFGVVLRPTPELRQHCETFAKQLQSSCGMPVHLHFYDGPDELAAAIESGECNLAWVSPALFLLRDEFRSFMPIGASVRESNSHYYGMLFVRQDSAIRSAEDLRGKRAAWVAKSSASGYIFPRLALAQVGIAPAEHFGESILAGTHAKVSELVASGQADVGAGYATFTDDEDATSPLRSASFVDAGFPGCRILLISPPVPADLFVVSQDLAAYRNFAAPITKAIETVPEAAYGAFGIDGIAPLSREHLRELSEAIDSARALDIL